jgi:hypothetical protein
VTSLRSQIPRRAITWKIALFHSIFNVVYLIVFDLMHVARL